MKRGAKRIIGWAAVLLLASAAVLVFLAETGIAERWMRDAIIRRVEDATGGRVTMGAFRFQLWNLHAELEDFTLHGHEAAGAAPLFHADRIQVSVRVISLWQKKIALDGLEVDRPAVRITVDANGQSNVPQPKRKTTQKPWNDRLFELEIGHLRLANGELAYNDFRGPLDVEGDRMEFTMDYAAPKTGEPVYVGVLAWEQVNLKARRYVPFRFDLGVKFTLAREHFELDELRWKLPNSEVQLRGTLASYTQKDFEFRYRVMLNLGDVRTILRKPHTPDGVVESSGAGRWANGKFSLDGHYQARNIAMRYQWFHAGGIQSRGRFTVADGGLRMPEFDAQALGGQVTGKMQFEFKNERFTVESHATGANLAGVLAAVDNRSLPVHTFHWDGTLGVDAVSTWTKDFQHFASRGTSQWSPEGAAAGTIPASADLNFNYSTDAHAVELTTSWIETPASRLEMDGTLGKTDSALETTLRTSDLGQWDDFINDLRGEDAEPRKITGAAEWRGRVLGPLGGPTFAGHVEMKQTHYDALFWDAIAGDLEYSPDALLLKHFQLDRGRSHAALELTLSFDGDWSFLPDSRWVLEARLDHADAADVEGFFQEPLPVKAIVSGTFRGSGTRAAPKLEGDFDLAEVSGYGYQANRIRGQMSLLPGELRLENVEVRSGPGNINGGMQYRWAEQTVEFNVTGTGVPLERIPTIQSMGTSIGGRLDFHAQGAGPIAGPTGEATLHLAELRFGGENAGTLEGTLSSDGRSVAMTLNSTAGKGRLHAQATVNLGDGYSIRGGATLTAMDVDPFIQSGLHLHALTGHSSVDGEFTITGQLARPETLGIELNLSSVSFDYEYVKLTNDGPVRLIYGHRSVHVVQAHLHGPNSDFTIAGDADFSGSRRLALRIGGTLDLRIATGFLPALDARGAAQMEVVIEGTIARPELTGRAHVENAAASYDDFPVGLSNVKGDFVFDRSRLLFDDATAEAGGGQLRLSGSVTYGDGPVRYDVLARSAQTRIRYPEGMSWQAGGVLRLVGTTNAGTLSGRVQVSRLVLSESFDLSTFLVSSREPLRAPSTTSAYLSNLQFDIEANSTPDARVEWAGAHFEAEASLRVRGTWEHPILLGHIHLLNGEMTFRGNRYTLNRGDLNFSNPFRLDPDLNVEATTTIRQYEITLDFTGPASRLTLSYRSDPPLPESDVIALLSSGSIGEESALRTSGTGAGQGYGTSALLSEAISSQVSSRLQRLFGITRFRVDPFLTGTGTEQNGAPRITVEQQVSRNFTVTYSSNAATSQQQVIQIEYSVSRKLSIVFLRDYNGTYSLDIVFKKQFK